MNKITLLNTSILTSYGTFCFTKMTLEEIKYFIRSETNNGLKESEIKSAIGHQSTAEILSELLKIPVKVNRVMYQQSVGDTAIIFKLNGRPEEGKILSKVEIEEIGYEFGLLVRLK